MFVKAELKHKARIKFHKIHVFHKIFATYIQRDTIARCSLTIFQNASLWCFFLHLQLLKIVKWCSENSKMCKASWAENLIFLGKLYFLVISAEENKSTVVAFLENYFFRHYTNVISYWKCNSNKILGYSMRQKPSRLARP